MESKLEKLYNLEVNAVQITHGCLPLAVENYKSKEIFNYDIYKQDQQLPLLLSNLIKNLLHYKSEEHKTTIIAKILLLFSLPSPYETKEGVRFLRGTSNFISEKLKIIAIDDNSNSFTYSSITECSKALKIGRTNIKNCLLSGHKYKNFKFIFGQ